MVRGKLEKQSEIVRRLGRDKTSDTRRLINRRPLKAQGRMRILTPAAVDMLGKLEGVIVKADGKYAVWVWWIYARSPAPHTVHVHALCSLCVPRAPSGGPHGAHAAGLGAAPTTGQGVGFCF